MHVSGYKKSSQRAGMQLKYCVIVVASYLKFELRAAEVGPLLLPEVVWFDNEGDVDAGGKRLLQDLQQRLDAVPFGAAHINDDREAMFTHLLAGMDGGRREWEELKRREGRGGGCEGGRGGERV